VSGGAIEGYDYETADPSPVARGWEGSDEPTFRRSSHWARDIVEETTGAFSDAHGEVTRLMTQSVLIAQRAVESAIAEAERRAQTMIYEAEEHARIVGERAQRVMHEALESQRLELADAVTESHRRLLDVLDDALHRFDSELGDETARPGTFFDEVRKALADHRREIHHHPASRQARVSRLVPRHERARGSRRSRY